jgi:hypothetical protein
MRLHEWDNSFVSYGMKTQQMHSTLSTKGASMQDSTREEYAWD